MTTRIGRWNVRKALILSRMEQETSSMCHHEVENLATCVDKNPLKQELCAGFYARYLVCVNRQQLEARKTKNSLGTLGYQFSAFNRKGMKQFKEQKP